MKSTIKKLRIAKDGYPVEEIEGRPVVNFFRRLLYTDHIECRDCWYGKQAQKNPDNWIEAKQKDGK